MRTARVFSMAVAIALLASCSDSMSPNKPAGIQITTGNGQTGTAGELLANPLTVRVLNADGIPLRGVTVQWTVTQGGGTVSQTTVSSAAGLATAFFRLGNTAGANTVEAAIAGAAPVTFAATGLAGLPGLLKISPDSFVTRSIGDTTSLSAVVSDIHANVIAGSAITWSSSNTTVADVSSAGLLTIKGRGTAIINAHSGGAAGTMTVRVISVARVVANPDSVQLFSINQTRQLGASAFDAQNVAMPGVVFTYATLTPAVASVSSSGVVKAVGNGTAQIVISGEGPSDTVVVRVAQVVKSVSVNPAVAGVSIGASTQLAGFGIDSLGTAVNGLAFTWSSSDTTIVKVSATGVATGVARGSAIITATSGALAGHAQVNVAVLYRGVTAGAFHTCAIGTVSVSAVNHGFCWGQQAGEGRLGNGATTSSDTAVGVVGGSAFAQISAGGFHTCGIDGIGAPYCWGANLFGELGTGSTLDSQLPVQVAGTFRTISAGDVHTCAIGTGDSAVYCWGNNSYGQLGIGAVSPSVCGASPCALSAMPISKASLNFTKVSAGVSHTCAIETPTGNVYCWGNNQYGQLGNGTNTASDTAGLVQTGATFTDIAAGDGFTCGVTTDSRVMCWGHNDNFQLGNGTTIDQNVPVQVGLGTGFTQVDAGGLHACARSSTGSVYCWGDNSYGQIGINSTVDVALPLQVLAPAALQFTAVATGTDHTCASTDSGLYCWGRNTHGQLGTGDTTDRLVPTAVK